MSIIEISIKKPLLIAVVFTVLTLGGLISYTQLNLELMPKMERPVLTVQTVYPGASASEVENAVTKTLEDALSSLENLNKISSVSMEGVSVITVELNERANVDLVLQDAQRKVSVVKSALPADVLDPSINKWASDELPIMNIAASAQMSPVDFSKFMEDRIHPRLAKLEGVGEVRMTGGTQREIRVNIDAEKLKTCNLSILQVLQAIESANVEIPAGNIENREAVFSVRLTARFTDLDELRRTAVATLPDGGKIRLMDVADVHDGIAEQRLINRIDGRQATGISIIRQSDANTVQVADLVKRELAAVEREFSDSHVKFEIPLDDSVFTKAAANAVVIDLLLVFLIVSTVCFVFLHNFRAGVIIMISIPLAIIPTFIVMFLMGYSLNLMSLLALSLVVGILVDDSIVVIENMFRHMEMGKSRRDAALDGCRQIMFTCVAMTLVIVVVFMPMAIAGGFIGNALNQFAIPIISATLFSLLGVVTFTPLLMSRFGRLTNADRKSLSGRFSLLVEGAFETLKTNI